MLVFFFFACTIIQGILMSTTSFGYRVTGDHAAHTEVSRALFSSNDSSTRQHLCSLCFKYQIKQCIPLHPLEHSDTERYCFACRKCASQWRNVRGSEGTPILMSCPSCFVSMPTNAITNGVGDGDTIIQTDKEVGEADTSSSVPLNDGFTDVERESGICGACEREGANLFCVPCGFPLCEICMVSSHQRGRYTTHKIVPLKSAIHMEPKVCNTHPSQPLNAYCVTCSTVICINCYLEGAHKGHSMESVESAARRTRLEVQEQVEKLRVSAAATQSLSADIEQRLLPLCNKALVFRQEAVKKCFNTLRNALEERECLMMNQVSNDVVHLSNTFSSLNTQCKVANATFQYTIESVRNTLEAMDDSEVTKFGEMMKKSLATVQETSKCMSDCCHSTAQIQSEQLSSRYGSENLISVAQEDEVIRLIRSLSFSSNSSAAPPASRPTVALRGTTSVTHVDVKTPELTLECRKTRRAACIERKEPICPSFTSLERRTVAFREIPTLGAHRHLKAELQGMEDVSYNVLQMGSEGNVPAKTSRRLELSKLELKKWDSTCGSAQVDAVAIGKHSVGEATDDSELLVGRKRSR
ncbi:B-box zinc finger, putative [Trypanosoma equiperdum]|uniref:B box-type domain-containing protein n=2 Tax=Trypanozoon TaxID=39700 RepID=Q38B08_TRYB2|nr:hypothetical protein, conserved [Trypanosoma brucei brucei TREU927]EAN78012.1 hypothetical protein, conserved [Trypanosoma brucei brucei TREU927]SCU66443.1 B-box zinc finger, putative [Trypanosoma equiperdum]